MTKLINRDVVDLTVHNGDVKVTIKPGDSAEVDVRLSWKDNPFVMAGLLEVVEPKKATKQKTEK